MPPSAGQAAQRSAAAARAPDRVSRAATAQVPPGSRRARARPRRLADFLGRREGSLGRAEVALAIPPGSARARSQRAFLRAAVACPQLAAVRGDRRANLLEVARILARCGSWIERDPDPRATSRPTRARVCAEAGICASTWKECRAQWQAWGYLGLVRQGRTEEARKMTRRRDVPGYDGNDAAVFVLCIPRAASAPPLTRPPQGWSSPEGTLTREPGEKTGDDQGQGQGRTALRAGSPATSAVPRDLARHPVLERLSDRAIAAFWRPFRLAGWSLPDWLWAINCRPDGRRHRKDASAVRRPAGWLRWRLSHWLGSDGRPRPSRSQRAAARREIEARQREADRRAAPVGERAAQLRAAHPGWYQTSRAAGPGNEEGKRS